jgi:hypothetical protein
MSHNICAQSYEHKSNGFILAKDASSRFDYRHAEVVPNFGVIAPCRTRLLAIFVKDMPIASLSARRNASTGQNLRRILRARGTFISTTAGAPTAMPVVLSALLPARCSINGSQHYKDDEFAISLSGVRAARLRQTADAFRGAEHDRRISGQLIADQVGARPDHLTCAFDVSLSPPRKSGRISANGLFALIHARRAIWIFPNWMLAFQA